MKELIKVKGMQVPYNHCLINFNYEFVRLSPSNLPRYVFLFHETSVKDAIGV